MVVDDSIVVRRLVADALAPEEDFEIVARAGDGQEALEHLEEVEVDVLILDVNMPVMDGIEMLEQLENRQIDLRTIVFSSAAEQGAPETIAALVHGADTYVTKPAEAEKEAGTPAAILRNRLAPKIRALCGTQFQEPAADRGSDGREPTETGDEAHEAEGGRSEARREVRPERRVEAVGIAASTGGPAALVEVLGALPTDLPVPVLVVQHMPPAFTPKLAERLDQTVGLNVREAVAGARVDSGQVWIAPGDRHVGLRANRQAIQLELRDDPQVNACRPSADVLFESMAEVYGAHTLAVVMTGMGVDGFDGCRAVHRAGGRILAQDRETSVAWGMPGGPVEADLVDGVRRLDRLGETIRKVIETREI